MFYDILEQKTPFSLYTEVVKKSRKVKILRKGLVHGFGAKLAIISIFLLGNTGQESVFHHILEEKSPL